MDTPPWERVSICPTPDWVQPEFGYDAEVKSKDGSHVTHLLYSWQVDAEAAQVSYATARRLETPLAVQHESQWSLDIAPGTSRVALHWLRLVREGKVVDQLKRERMRLLQRETQLERHVINGSWTLLIVLEDVRPGDVLEAAYTMEWRHPVRPEGCEAFFVVPPQATVGRHRLSVLSAPSRTNLRWKASADAPPLREESAADGRRLWIWEGAQLSPREAEPNQPSAFLDYTWVQLSDLADWPELAERVEASWMSQGAPPGAEHDSVFAKPDQVDASAILGLVRHVQDSFRYLSVNLETGGWIAAAPTETARRRHGDCKDLAWLAAAVLRSWGVAARPVLVGTGLRERVKDMLPAAMLFNHAILEVEWAGERRWFDLTARDQGGDFAGQPVVWFSQGLVVGGEGAGLVAQPGRRHGGGYSLRETLLVDTHRNAVSTLEIRIRVEGWQADGLRRDRLAQGADQFAKEREQQAARRHGRARRSGELRWRDDRTANVVELVEMFEVTDAVYPGEQGQRAIYDAPAHPVAQGFLLPEDKPRRGPWDMPYPLEVAHEIIVRSSALGVGSGTRRRWNTPEFEANLECSLLKGTWSKRVRFRVSGPEIAAERLPEYRRDLETLFREIGWRLYLPWGHARSRRTEGLGELGEPGADPVSGASLAAEASPRERTVLTGDAQNAKISSGRSRRRRSAPAKTSGTFSFHIPLPNTSSGGFRLGIFALVLVLAVVRGCLRLSH